MQFNLQALAVLAAALVPFTAAMPARKGPSMQIQGAGSKIVDNYIVVLKSNVDVKTFEQHQNWATNLHNSRLARRDDTSLTGVKYKYNFDNLKGYAGAFDTQTIEQIKANGDVAFVEQDQIMVAFDLLEQKQVPSWGLSRVSEKKSNATSYFYDSSAGTGATAYVIDTGINIEHSEFEGRAKWGHNTADESNTDGQGHGSHVAGTIAGKTYGIAKKATLIAVKVLDESGSGSTSGVIAGVEWATSDAKTKGTASKSVANMSLGGSYSKALNAAVAAAVEAGITFAVAAGNENSDASQTSPASTESALTVGATDIGDARAVYSNFGPIVDVFAPGTGITSAWIGSNTAKMTISGTSMASPHVAGLAAYLISAENLSGSKAVTARIKELATKGVVTDPGEGSPNSLIYNGSGK